MFQSLKKLLISVADFNIFHWLTLAIIIISSFHFLYRKTMKGLAAKEMVQSPKRREMIRRGRVPLGVQSAGSLNERPSKTKSNNKIHSEKLVRDNTDKTGIYKVKCDDCPSFYIGQTARSFSESFKEHLPRKSSKSAYANHLIDSKHNYTNLEILHFCNKSSYMNTVEEFDMQRSSKDNPQHLLNDKLSFESNITYNMAIEILGGSGSERKGPDKDDM